MAKVYQKKIYEEVANIYGHIMHKVHYDYWADYIYSITNHALKNKPKVLELASGNCNLAAFLSEYYPNYIASDSSIAMLRKCNDQSLKKVCCDMRQIPLKGKFDLIVSVFDSINYLIRKLDLLMLFREIRRLLDDNGIFTFDVGLEKNSYKHIKDAVRIGSYKGYEYKQESQYNPKTRIHRNIFHIVFKNGERYKETHIQKIYPFETYFRLIDNTGLIVIECFDAFTYKTGNAKSSRIQFIIAKK